MQKLALPEKGSDFLERTMLRLRKGDYLRNWWTSTLKNIVLSFEEVRSCTYKNRHTQSGSVLLIQKGDDYLRDM